MAERRKAERRLEDIREYGRELTDEERNTAERRVGERRTYNRRREELEEARSRQHV